MDFSAVRKAEQHQPADTGASISFEGTDFGPPEILPSELRYVRKIGHGCFGNVYVGECRGKEVAIKKLYRQEMEEKALESFKREVRICSRIHHPNITLFMGACMQPGEMAIVTELLPLGNLEQVLHDPGRKIPLSQRMRMAKDAAQGINWLHCSNPTIMHRDIKPSNLLVADDGRIKVCDFGLSVVKEKGEKHRDHGKTPGTPLWMAPEVLMGRPVDEKSDVYSFAIVLWEIATQQIPFPDMTARIFKRSICIEGVRPPLDESMLPRLRALLRNCWQKNASKRPSFAQIIVELDKLIVEAAVDNDVCRALWQEEFTGLAEVPWDAFIDNLTRRLDMPPLDDTSPEWACCQALFAVPSRDAMLRERPYVVSLEHFGQVLSCFSYCAPRPPPGEGGAAPLDGSAEAAPPLASSGDGPRPRTIIDHVTAAVLQPWFHGDIDRVEAEKVLQNKCIGTFLIRMSFTMKRAPFTISKINREGKLNHHRIECTAGGVLRLKRGATVFESQDLVDLISRAREELMLQTSCPSSKYAAIQAALSGNLTPSTGYESFEELQDL